jgi:hypothetical protein
MDEMLAYIAHVAEGFDRFRSSVAASKSSGEDPLVTPLLPEVLCKDLIHLLDEDNRPSHRRGEVFSVLDEPGGLPVVILD